jgi:hypothetical protein
MANNNLTNANFANIATVNANGGVIGITTGNLTASGNVTGTAGSFSTLVTTSTTNFTSGNVSLGAFQEAIYSLGGVSGTVNVNYSNGTVQKMTLGGSITINTSNISNMVPGRSLTLILTQGGSGSNTLTSNMLFASGNISLSVGVGLIDIVNIFYDGTYYYASIVKGYQ